ncbi:helicase-related protein [Terrisporobacter vanillatitrophus]|uniref:helicase-related protein n=1 Tax=Terrisporobacter vanillatitrophus TaxID=3058402 RepID=UPI003367BAC0
MNCVETREKILDEVKRELLGPGSEDICKNIEEEIITDNPIQRYSVGILYPQKNIVDEAKGDDFDKDTLDEEVIEDDNKNTTINNTIDSEVIKAYEDNEDNDLDQEISMANQYLPSAMGMTFFVKDKDNINKLKLNISYATYKCTKISDCHVKYKGEDFFTETEIERYIERQGEYIYLREKLTKSQIRELVSRECLSENSKAKFVLYKLASQCHDSRSNSGGYIRQPIEIKDIEFLDIDKEYINVCPIQLENDNLSISISTRKYDNKLKSITVMFINNNDGQASISNTIFQPTIEILPIENKGLEFIDIFSASQSYSSANRKDKEELSLDLLYRNKKTYATGHGVSADQEIDETGKLKRLYTNFIPTYEVAKLDFNIEELSDVSQKLLSMKNLSDISNLSKNKQIELLNRFKEVYKDWIKKLESESEHLNDIFKSVSQKHIEECYCVAKRMEEGIELINNNKDVYDAFTLMNRALLMQRAHSKVGERLPDSGELKNINYNEEESSWRPFQLAYILMCISSVENPKSQYRDIVDLIWVPTGGGKTEAYLGLSAFTIFLRRLRNPVNGYGTTIIMRYTLRLLAAQQFIRASIMICACEVIRRENIDKLGKEEISIGLWIGSAQTPNTINDAQYELNGLKRTTRSEGELNRQKAEHNKFQVLKCPWCGTKMEKVYEKNKESGDWGYRHNKKDKCFEIFCPEQDCDFELKLPIKVVDEDIYKNPPTLLFATVDKFAMMTWKSEVSRLFALDKGNDNLSPELIIQDELHLISGPLGTMVGLYETVIDAMCSEKGIKPKIIASTATIRRAAEQVKGLYNRDVKQFPPPGLCADDSFFVKNTPVEKEPGRLYVGIMPSGKTQTTVEVRLMSGILQRINMIDNIDDKIKDRYWTLVAYFNSIRELGKCTTLVSDDIADNMSRVCRRISAKRNLRFLYKQKELTSRLSATEINNTLNDLDVEYLKTNDTYTYPIDVLLATNMISVGVDVERLNCMVVVGQPKLTSEYIQASSRVGRHDPGIVFTLYNSSKTRDRSHYEQFYKYHQSFYKFVEPTSVTPFSEPARERGLHAIFISMVRHILGLQKEELASNFSLDINLDKIKNNILERAKSISNTDEYDIEEELLDELEKITIWWDEKVKSLQNDELLQYSKESAKNKLIIPFDKNIKTNEKQTLQSMRNVDKQCKVEIITL